MVRNKLYNLIKRLLEAYPRLRDSDKQLVWVVWGGMGLHDGFIITKDSYMKAPPLETITRCRRKIQEYYPNLRASQKVQQLRVEKERMGGNFVYQEEYEPEQGELLLD